MSIKNKSMNKMTTHPHRFDLNYYLNKTHLNNITLSNSSSSSRNNNHNSWLIET